MFYIYLNGKTVPENEAYVSIKDRGFLYGDGLFETIRAYNGNAFKLDTHLDRLFTSAKELKILPSVDTRTNVETQYLASLQAHATEIHQAVRNLLSLNGLSDAYIRITLTRGQIPVRIADCGLRNNVIARSVSDEAISIPNSAFHTPHSEHPTLLIETRPLTPYPQEYYKHGVSIIISKTRISTSWPLTAHKTLNFMNNIMAREDAKSLGAQEVLFLNTDGHVAECSVSNIFFVKNNEVITPSLKANILPGITRKVVLEICKQNGIVAREDLFNLETLVDADEAFLTNSLMEVMPVSTIDKHPLSPPMPGKLTKQIMEAYSKLTLQHISKE